MSGNKVNRQAVFAAQTTLNPNQAIDEVAMFNSAGISITFPNFVSVTTNDAGATVAKTTTSTEPPANSFVFVKYAGTNGNTVASTLTFSGGVARTVWLGGTPPTALKHTVTQNGIVGYWFDGTILHQLGSM